MSSPTLTRRALLAGAGTAIASAALAIPYARAANSEDTCALSVDEDTDGLTGLALAAVHIDRAVQAMGSVTMGRWQVTITSGDADQSWNFKQINPNRTEPLQEAISEYRDGLAAFEAFSRTDVTDDDRDAFAAISYSPPMERLEAWGRPAVTRQGAVEALRLARDENLDWHGTNMVTSLLTAALAYFDRTS